jgi:type II secretory ATPase GspE/PulE/Tfp pilus assembly ATPase PilB-like protein
MYAAAEGDGMIPIVEDGFAKAIQGLTSLEEILRVTKE